MEVESLTNNNSIEHSTWKYIFTDLADPRTSGWFLISNPIPLFAILASYLYFVLKCGPNYMKDKSAYSLKKTIMAYNLFQVAFNAYLFHEAVAMWSTYNWICQPVDYSNSPIALAGVLLIYNFQHYNVKWAILSFNFPFEAMAARIILKKFSNYIWAFLIHAWSCYLYFLNKLTDLVDTVFFTLRKKNNQVSFLHLFHHTLMPVVSWIMVKYIPGGQITFTGLLNTFVHIILYGYYFLAACGPEVQKYLWWKKYITKLQLAQFVLVFLQNCQIMFFECDFPKWTLIMILPNTIFFFVLFSNFYKRSYSSPKSESKAHVKTK